MHQIEIVVSLTPMSPLCKDLERHFAGHVGQAEITSAIKISQPLMIHAEDVQNGRMQIVDVHALLHSEIAVVVGRAVSGTPFYAAARHPHRIAVGIVVATVSGLRNRRAAEFSTPNN